MKVLIIPNDSLESYNKKGLDIGKEPHLYFDPNGKLEELVFLYKGERKYLKKKGKFKYFSFLGKSRIINIFKYIYYGYKIIKKYKINIIRTYNPHIEGLVTIILGKLFGIKTVVSLHNDFEFERQLLKKRKFFNFLQKILENISYKYCDKIIVVSSYLKAYLIKNGVKKGKIKLILNSFDFSNYIVNNNKIAEIRNKYLLNGYKVFINIGRLVEQKNHINLLKAFYKLFLENKHVKLLIIGKGNLENKLKNYVKDNGLKDNVYFLGNISNKDIINYLKASDFFIFSSHYEGFGKVLVEAQYSKLPILSSNIPTIKDIVSEKNSLFFDKDNIDDIYEKMKYAINNIKLLNRSYNLEKFYYKTNANEEYKLYNYIII